MTNALRVERRQRREEAGDGRGGERAGWVGGGEGDGGGVYGEMDGCSRLETLGLCVCGGALLMVFCWGFVCVCVCVRGTIKQQCRNTDGLLITY